MYMHAFQLLAALLVLCTHIHIDRSVHVHTSTCFYKHISAIHTSMYTYSHILTYYIYAYLSIWMCVRSMMHVGMHISMFKTTVCTYMYICICVHICIYMCACVCVSEFVSACVCARVRSYCIILRLCIYIHMCIYTHIYIYVYIYIYMNTHIHMYTYTCIYVHTHKLFMRAHIHM